MEYYLEKKYEVWNDTTGEHFEIGPDKEGIGLLSIYYVSEEGKRGEGLSFTYGAARLIRKALDELLEEGSSI